MLKTIFISAFLFLSTGLIAEAGRMNACKGDAEKFCKGIQPGGGRIIKCLKEHTKDLSEPCKAIVGMADQMAEKMAQGGMAGLTAGQNQVPDVCKADFEQFCKDAGDGKKRDCMLNNLDKFSAPCKSAIEAKRAQRLRGLEQLKQNKSVPPQKK